MKKPEQYGQLPPIRCVSWRQLTRDDKQLSTGCNGNCYISSCGEVLLKTSGIKSFMNEGSSVKPIFFRGEHIYGWELIPRIVRNTGLKHNDINPLNITSDEIEYLKAFQKKYINSKIKWLFQTRKKKEDPNWWSLMAHYDDEVGTKMIDITSSIFCALYFACVD